MAKNQKSYTLEFKQQIVDLYNAKGTSYPQLEREYGVNRSTMSGWVKQLSPSRYPRRKLSPSRSIRLSRKKLATGHPAVSSGSSGIWQSRGYVLSWERNTTTMPIIAVS